MQSMQIGYTALPDGLYAFALAVLFVLIITMLVVWPADWAQRRHGVKRLTGS